LDKTGTITIGNRKSTNFYPAQNADKQGFMNALVLSSLADETPEGKSIVELAISQGMKVPSLSTDAEFIRFTAETRSSGVNLSDGARIRKGAFDAMRNLSEKAGNQFPIEVAEQVKTIPRNW